MGHGKVSGGNVSLPEIAAYRAANTTAPDDLDAMIKELAYSETQRKLRKTSGSGSFLSDGSGISVTPPPTTPLLGG